jgi:hypothetical protein
MGLFSIFLVWEGSRVTSATVSGWPSDFSMTISPGFKSMISCSRLIDAIRKISRRHDGPITVMRGVVMISEAIRKLL